MKLGNSNVMTIGSKTAGSSRKSVLDTLDSSASEAREQMEDLAGTLNLNPMSEFGDVAKALFAIDFLANFYLNSTSEDMPDHMASSFADIASICGRKVGVMLAQKNALYSLASELEQDVKTTGTC
jgi:hypothetical protein